MCGIAGYIGNAEAKDFLINALKRLEYRGYDSAGIAVLKKGGEVRCVKKAGKIKELDESLKDADWEENVGIAHTRWATHGVPSEGNAHPHCDCTKNIYLAHNGIIENYKSLKEKLETEGHVFRSNTDTEVLAHLIEKHFSGNLEEAVLNALGQVEGAYALAIIAKDDPDKVVVAKKSSPLVLGFADGETFVASDPSALVGYTDSVIYMDDGELGVITRDDYRIISIEDYSEIEKKPDTIELDLADIQKNGFDYFLLKEIFEVPEVIRNSTRGRMIIEEGLAKLGGLEVLDQERLRRIERIIIIGCGSASYAARVGEYMLEEYAGIPVEVELGSEFRYRKPIIDESTAVLVVSQSGETADSLASLLEAKRKGAMCLGVVNVVGSTIARATDAGVYNHAGPEIAVASTKAFISQIVVLALITVYLGRMRDMSVTTGKRILEEIEKLPELVDEVLKDSEHIHELAKKYSAYGNFLYLGRKYNNPIASEGALKIKEVCYVHAEGYAGGEMKHGPLAMIDDNFPCVFIAPRDSVYDKMRSNMEEVKARNGKIIAVTTKGNEDLGDIVSDTIYIPKTLEMLTPVLSCIPLYLFAAYVGIEKGLDVDKPRNLAKSVTVE